ncbi:MAG: formate dehydrogenase accessory sulfurtransferase FdhD [Desulfarculaceae bacterium]|nr:formate dehydrogenase accessory sulfurtransferase FdhD [Desulfarculaceae bacterium]MCF8065663.1 formate dehydrogenase accessory sulfurtransferase FdhD [Desulfarculaceae bacterium]MCF8097605.1 formate dehydrogenase accessory sulfurtransferase FdhD [Desulfarculaceae bacterium]MCF8121174.1 formate dehydrogenase accessory sulfurtransferase FdhD [Desulfarculaceae bacterium]
MHKQPDPQNVVQPLEGLRVEADQVRVSNEDLAVEAPCEIRLGGRSYVLLMATPADLEHLALGFCITEGIVSGPQEVLGVSLGQDELPGVGQVFWADVSLPPELARGARARRSAPAATSCGLCGLESFRDLGSGISSVESSLTVEMAAIQKLFIAMETGQRIYRRTGAAHAVALGTAQGELLHLAEDVGRHNAMDKSLGMALGQGRDLGQCVCTVSGRISLEMALKAARAGVPVVCSVSAATSLGRQICAQAGITLVGFVRQGRATVYCHPQRVLRLGKPLQDG